MISDDNKTYDIAYCVHKDLWGQGFATEIAKGLIDYSKRNNAEKVTIFVNQDNGASMRVAEKCGGEITSQDTFVKKGTKEKLIVYKYEVIL